MTGKMISNNDDKKSDINKEGIREINYKIRFIILFFLLFIWGTSIYLDISLTFSKSNIYLFLIQHASTLLLVVLATFPEIVTNIIMDWIYNSN